MNSFKTVLLTSILAISMAAPGYAKTPEVKYCQNIFLELHALRDEIDNYTTIIARMCNPEFIQPSLVPACEKWNKKKLAALQRMNELLEEAFANCLEELPLMDPTLFMDEAKISGEIQSLDKDISGAKKITK